MATDFDIDSRLLEEPASRLEIPIKLKDLLTRQDFTIRSMDETEIERQDEMDISQVYSYEELEPYCLTELLEVPSDEDDDPTCDEISKSFPIFRKKMTKITEDGKVMKLIERESYGEKVPNEGEVVVYMHYAAYVELIENPFDCTRLRQKKPESKKLGVGEVLPGLEIALRSMRKGEKAKFLVHPDLAFKERGVPPRIPPQATILYDVELIDVCENTRVEELKSEDRTFDESLELAQKLRIRGNKLKKLEKNINGAISSYRKGLQIIIEATYDNDEDELRRKKEVLHFYTNLAVCYLEKKRYRMVCSMYNDAYADCGDLSERHVKLLYASGKALRMLGSFDESLVRLRRALKLKPADESILKELTETINARKKYLDEEKNACIQMFGFMNLKETPKYADNEVTVDTSSVESDFIDLIDKELNTLESPDQKNVTINSIGYTYAEKQFIRKECARRNLLFRTPRDDIIVIIKKSA